MNFEELLDFFKKMNIKIENEQKEGSFNRNIKFSVNNQKYIITWFKNVSTLYIGESLLSAQIPFRYVYYDRTFPLTNGNRSLGFSYSKKEKKSMFDREYPYEVIRIPLENKELTNEQ